MTRPQSYEALLAAAKERILYQDEALSELAVLLHYHLKSFTKYEDFCKNQSPQALTAGNLKLVITIKTNTEAPKPTGIAPIFILGKTGAGKTHLIKELCQLCGVNFLAVNATHLSNAGYKGMTLAEVGEMLLKAAEGNLTKALFSVVFFDEFDKLFIATNDNQASYHRSLATELLTILEGTSPFPVKDKDGIDSRYMLFLLGGSFGLHQKTTTNIGFVGAESSTVLPERQLDFLELGFFEELAGRIGKVIALKPLDNRMLADILKSSPSSPLVNLQRLLALENCTFAISDACVDALISAEEEAIEKFGVRGLYQAFNQLPKVHEVLVRAVLSKHATHFELLEKDKLIETAHPSPSIAPAPTNSQALSMGGDLR